MPRTIAFDWEADHLAGVEADVSLSTVHVRRCFRYDWPEETDPPQGTAALGRWLAESLKKDGISPGEARVVLPREAVVVRKLDLPNVPEDELPDLVRFQAATKSSTPLDRLVLDYLPLPVEEGDTTQQVLMVTIDGERLKWVRDTLAAAGIDLKAVGISPVAVGELVSRMRKQTTEPNQATLVIFQDARRVEITTLVQQRVTFTHHTRLSGAEDAAGLQASLAEINRTVIALSQSQSELDITEVCLIHAGDADPAFENSLTERFAGRLHVLDVTKAAGLRIGRPADRPGLASYAPVLGSLLAEADPCVAAIDFLDPRRVIVPPDRTKLRIGIGTAAAVLVGGIGYWMFSSHLADLASQTASIKEQVRDLDIELKQGEPDLDAAKLIGDWAGRSHDLLAVMNRFNRLAPGTDRVYLTELSLKTEMTGRSLRRASRAATLRLVGRGNAIDLEDVEQLQEDLERGGFRVEPKVGGRSNDPDYPHEFLLEIELSEPEETTLTTAMIRDPVRQN